MGKTPAEHPELPEGTADEIDETTAEEFDFDENAAEEIERALDDSDGHENERGLTNWHIS